ncbi:MAG: hypothetical protein ACHQ7M_14145, partial [Chloroflexota bacterium]
MAGYRNAGMILGLSLCLWASVLHADDGDGQGMPGVFGSYPMTRDASGTSWQPDAAGMDGVMSMHDDWMTMLHGYLNQIYDHQGGPRGATEDFSESMAMAMAERQWGADTL